MVWGDIVGYSSSCPAIPSLKIFLPQRKMKMEAILDLVFPGRDKVASPESITAAREYGFRACALRAHPGMTAVFLMSNRPRGARRPSFVKISVPPGTEGAGKTGCWLHPWQMRKKRHRFNRSDPAFPARVVYGLYALSSVYRAF